MTNIFKDLKNIILEEHNDVNDKLTGINFLETFKFNLISKLSSLESQKWLKDIKENTNIMIHKNNKKLEANIIYNQDSKSQKLTEIKKNTLYVVLNGKLILDIYQNDSSENYIKTNIHPLMGICLSPSTKINFNSIKNTSFIEFLKIEKNSDIENLKKDII